MLQLRSKPVSAVNRKASSLATGRTPGKPRQTGQTFVFGGAPNSLAQPHHILDLVLSWTCVSSPMTASYSMCKSIRQPGAVVLSSGQVLKQLCGLGSDLEMRSQTSAGDPSRRL